MSFLIRGSEGKQLHKVALQLDACIGLFAAADMLKVGHVSGVPPYLYVRKLSEYSNKNMPGLVPCSPGESPKIILRQSNSPESLFRGAVNVDGMNVADVLQLWLDVSAHPSRGREQAEHLRQNVLYDVIGRHDE